MCIMASTELERVLNSIIKYIGKSFDYSVLKKSNNLVLLFCKLPDFVGEISCDASIVAILSRQKTFLDRCFVFNLQESNSIEQKYLNDMRQILQKWVYMKKNTNNSSVNTCMDCNDKGILTKG